MKPSGKIMFALAPAVVVLVGMVLLIAARGGRGTTWWTDGASVRVRASAETPRRMLWTPAKIVADADEAGVDEYEPRVSPDGATLVFVKRRPGGQADLFIAKWRSGGWSAPEAIAGINSPSDELGPEFSPDGGAIYFYSDRAGGFGGYDVWRSSRTPEGWGAPVNLGAGVNTEDNEYAPALTPDGARLYFASNRPRAGEAKAGSAAWPATMREDRSRHDYDLYVAESAEGEFQGAAAVAELNTPADEGSPAVSPAGDFLYFASDRAGGRGGYDLYRARLKGGVALAPENAGEGINTPANELDPGLSTDGFRLYFSSDRSRPDEPLVTKEASADAGDGGARPGAADEPSRDASRAGIPSVSNAMSAVPGDRAARTYALWFSTSREVYEEREAAAWSLAQAWRDVWPWLLLLLASLLVLLLARWAANNPYFAKRLAQLSLLAKCLLASVLIHFLLALLFAVWQVGSRVGELFQSPGGGGTRVIVSSGASVDGGDALVMQVRGDVTSVDAPAPTLPTLARADLAPAELNLSLVPSSPAAQAMPMPARIEASAPASAAMPAPQVEVSASAPERDASRAWSESLPRPLAPNAAREEAMATTPTPEVPTSAAAPMAGARFEPASAPAAPTPLTPVAPAGRVARGPEGIEAAPMAASVPTPTLAFTPVNEASERTSSASSVRVPGVPSAPTGGNPASEASGEVNAALPESTPAPMGVGSSVASAPAGGSKASPIAWRDSSRSGVGVRPAESEPVASAVAPASVPDVPSDRSAATLGAIALPRATPASAPPSGSEETIASRDWSREGPASKAAPIGLPASATRDAASSRTPSGVAPLRTPAREAAGSKGVTSGPREAEASFGTANGLPFALSSNVPASSSMSSSSSSRLPALPAEPVTPVETFAQRTPEVREDVLREMGGSAETEKAVRLALDWLGKHQERDGRWSARGFDERCQCGGAAEFDADTAMTGLSLLCYLGAGHTHTGEGAHRERVARAIDWLLTRQAPDGDLRRGETMYGQTIASVALCEALAMTGDQRLADPARRAFALILNEASERGDARRGASNDASVLGWLVMAIESARRAGLEIPPDAFKPATAWLDYVADPRAPGRYSYRRGEAPSAAMTAEAMFVRQLTGQARTQARMEQSARFILETPPRWKDGAPTYYWYYATLALFEHQGDAWTRWNEAIAPELLKHQRQDGNAAGSWDPQDPWSKMGGRIYQTAVCTLSLEVYYRYRPAGMKAPGGR